MARRWVTSRRKECGHDLDAGAHAAATLFLDQPHLDQAVDVARHGLRSLAPIRLGEAPVKDCYVVDWGPKAGGQGQYEVSHPGSRLSVLTVEPLVDVGLPHDG